MTSGVAEGTVRQSCTRQTQDCRWGCGVTPLQQHHACWKAHRTTHFYHTSLPPHHRGARECKDCVGMEDRGRDELLWEEGEHPYSPSFCAPARTRSAMQSVHQQLGCSNPHFPWARLPWVVGIEDQRWSSTFYPCFVPLLLFVLTRHSLRISGSHFYTEKRIRVHCPAITQLSQSQAHQSVAFSELLVCEERGCGWPCFHMSLWEKTPQR